MKKRIGSFRNGVSVIALGLIFGTASIGPTAAAEKMDYGQFSWDGFYAGAFVGGARMSGKLGAGSDSISFDVGGTNVGLTLGKNWDRGSYVFGIEGDISLGELNFARSHDMEVESISSIRGRLGVKTGQALIFLTAGAGILTGTAFSSAGPSISFTEVRPVIGAGVEFALTERISAKIDGLAFLGKDIFNHDSTDEFDLLKDVFVLRAGINFRF